MYHAALQGTGTRFQEAPLAVSFLWSCPCSFCQCGCTPAPSATAGSTATGTQSFSRYSCRQLVVSTWIISASEHFLNKSFFKMQIRLGTEFLILFLALDLSSHLVCVRASAAEMSPPQTGKEQFFLHSPVTSDPVLLLAYLWRSQATLISNLGRSGYSE